MDFFKSVFSSDPDPPEDDEEEEKALEEEAAEGELDGTGAADPPSPVASEEDVGRGDHSVAWGGFSGLIRTLATRSESVIQTYRRDLEEFGSGLRKETATIREVIRDLPSSLEAGASVAQESLESVGQAIDDLGGSVWRGTADIIAQGKDAILSLEADASPDPASSPGGSSAQSGGGAAAASNRPYSRFEARVLAIQSDPDTFSDEPEDAEDYAAWIAGFLLAEKAAEVGSLLAESRALEGNLARLVPQVVDYETFWSRYFYRVHKLKQAEDVRANLVKRVISREEEEEDLSWEVDDDDAAEKDGKEEEQGKGHYVAGKEGDERRGRGEPDVSVAKKEETGGATPEAVSGEKSVENAFEAASASASGSAGEKMSSEVEEDRSENMIREAAIKADDKMMPPEGKGEAVESCKDSDVSVLSSQPSMPEEDDLGWDEIEDLGDNDEKKGTVSGGSPAKIDLGKKLSIAEEDEDLSWDIEDDDPIKP